MKLNRTSALFAGIVLAAGAPLGWLAISNLIGNSAPILYFYLASSTTIVFGTSGYWVGRIYERQEELANTDKLTGLDNRRAFQEKCAMLMNYCVRKQQPISMLFLDLDNFKRLNDMYGHEAGDQGLKCLAALLRECVRDSDIISRLGGDEFAIFLPGTDEAQSAHLVNRIREKFTKTVQTNEKLRQLNVSIGVASSDSREAKLENLIKKADEKMYLEKKKKHNASRSS